MTMIRVVLQLSRK
uniref:Uncharacterized protein n=1 Tax=Arundo donax TaxID=35708 RepID=A0A0A8XMW5_ARUDO